MLFKSSGILEYSDNKLIVQVDPEIVSYYRALMPKWIKTNKQMYPPHISVVRNETPLETEHWGKYQGEEVEFQYSNEIRHGKVYYWLDAYSKHLEKIRLELGMTAMSDITKPPSHKSCFHITIGNLKNI